MTQENAVLTIKSYQRTEDQSDTTELNAKAFYRYAPDQIEITYPELDDTGAPCGRTTVTVFSDSLVTVEKVGFVGTKMVVETGRSHLASYRTIAGTMDLKISAIEISPRLSAEGGVLRLRYLLEINDDFTAENILELKVRRKVFD